MHYLTTYFDTILSYDPKENTIYHGSNPHHFILPILDNDNLYLHYDDRYILFDSDCMVRFSNEKQPVESISFGNDMFSIKCGKYFLGAEPQNVIEWKQWSKEWEKFKLGGGCANNTKDKFIEYIKNIPTGSSIKVAFCCGSRSYGEDWFCTDINQNVESCIYYADISGKLPFPSNSVDFVFIEHGLEHVNFTGVVSFCKEVFRILKENGILRISSPSLDNWISYYVINNEKNDRITDYISNVSAYLKPVKEFGITSKAMCLNNVMRNWGHLCLLDFATYRDILLKVGFLRVSQGEIHTSRYKELKNIERRKDEYSKFETLVIEAKK